VILSPFLTNFVTNFLIKSGQRISGIDKLIPFSSNPIIIKNFEHETTTTFAHRIDLVLCGIFSGFFQY